MAVGAWTTGHVPENDDDGVNDNIEDNIDQAFLRDEYEVNDDENAHGDDENAHGDDRYQGLVRMPLSAACLTTSPPPAGSRCSIRTQPTFKRKTFHEYVERPTKY